MGIHAGKFLEDDGLVHSIQRSTRGSSRRAEMFCFQREQTRRPDAGAGRSAPKRVCGKEEVTAHPQDVRLHQLKGIGQYRKRLGALGRQPDLAARPPQREFRR
jgi:hypothetical protein